MHPRARATAEDLYRVSEDGRAELTDGEIVAVSPTGGIPDRAGGRIHRSPNDYERSGGGSYAFPGNVGFVVCPPRRGSFSLDAAFHVGPWKGGEGDHGAGAGREIAQKREDYFAAGTLVMSDVDVLQERVVRVYRAEGPDMLPAVCRRGDVAGAEPALPGRTMPVEDLLP